MVMSIETTLIRQAELDATSSRNSAREIVVLEKAPESEAIRRLLLSRRLSSRGASQRQQSRAARRAL